MTDPIADMLTRIRNAKSACHQVVPIPFSNLKYEIARILEKKNFIEKIEKKKIKTKKIFEITLKCNQGVPIISGLKRISKPGQRIYLGYSEIKKVKGGYGVAIISTSKGLMTDDEVKKQKIGGEVLCEIW